MVLVKNSIERIEIPINFDGEARVSFNTAKLAKEKGIKCKSTHFYIIGFNSMKPDYNIRKHIFDDRENVLQSVTISDYQKHLASAPTLSHLQKIFRDIYKIDINISDNYKFNIKFNNDDIYEDSNVYETYEEALDIGLQTAL